uniref:Contactin associated protein-like 5a n=1 Tax=Scophthalmus maximus TaxID=52904 RepID=A0A8D3D2P1_SCOMX
MAAPPPFFLYNDRKRRSIVHLYKQSMVRSPGVELMFNGSPLHFPARLPGAGGWSPMVTDQEPWLQVDLREQLEVTAVATQGRYDSWDWVSSYLLLYSDTGRAWKQYRHEDGVGRFVGNVNSEAVVQNKLSHPVRTRFLRFVPLDWNPSGWMGLRVEVYGCSYKSFVADFDGRSSLLYRFNQKSMSTVKDVISLRFKSHQAEGVLLHGEGQRGDYITLELHRGRLDLYLNLDDSRLRFSSGRVAVTVGSLLDDQHWHSVHMERFNKQVNLTVDSHTQHFQTKGEGHSLEVDYELSFGGIPLPGKPGTFLRKNFHGCMENLYYNGINIIDLAKRRKPQIHSVVSWTDVAEFSFLSLPSAAAAARGVSVRFQFRTWNPDGLLLSAPLNPEPQRLELRISGGQLHLTLRGAGQQNDGLWHSVSLDAGSLQVTLAVDGEPSSTTELWEPAELRGSFYFGGERVLSQRDIHAVSYDQRSPITGFNAKRAVARGQRKNNCKQAECKKLFVCLSVCLFSPRCLPNLCEHGGRCSQTWSSFACDCAGTGYSGATCHNSIYESSCEAYKLIGSSSGFYSIDPDGSGPLGPAQVYCNMTEEKVWTVVSHNITAPVTVLGSSPLKPHVATFNYSASAEQLRAIVSGSEQCQQEVVYGCRKSRLFNTKDGSPLSWWLDRDGERRSYWGGFLPGVQQCSCSLEENCADMNYFCNCDADADAWANDTGILSYKDHLPVSQIVIGDTNRTGSRAVYHIGPLRCYGDKSIWNAASFYQESSYLYFPTLQAELSSDVSFYFKTSAPSGVFLENLGLKDFIRVELSSPSVVTFSFDVGNGPALLSVKSHLPLNDRQWHYVRAERNVREASLQVDQLPLRFLEAPADGHLRLRLSSQLFIGGTASQQRGFLGCIRTLTVNGVGFDLEERARMTPGVSSGCPGYCSGSSSLCHNRGRCVEKSNGFICDCSQSAYGGDHLSQATSVSAESSSRAREDVAFSFVTAQRPAMLLTVGTFSRQYIAVVLAKNGSLQIWYHLQTDRSPDVFSPVLSNLADGRLHRIRIHRVGKNLYVQVSRGQGLTQAASKGFVGCLSSVQFNHVAPLKAALTNRGSSLVTIRGPLVQSNCGALAESTSHTLQGTKSARPTGLHPLLRFHCCYVHVNTLL